MKELGENGCVAVVLAGGRGSRFGGEVPKQFMELAGECVLARAVRAFNSAPGVEEVLVVVPAEWHAQYTALGMEKRFAKLRGAIVGGDTRSNSVLSAVNHYSARQFQGRIILHDGARPLVTVAQLERVVQQLNSCEVVASVLPCHDTLYRVSSPRDAIYEGVARRENHLMAQTPQGFHFPLLREVFSQWVSEGKVQSFTDEVSMVLAYRPGVKLGWAEGERANIKITSPGDMLLARALLEAQGLV